MNKGKLPEVPRLSSVFAAASTRAGLWRQLNALTRAWANLSDKSARAEELRGQASQLFERLRQLEHCWAYPGPRLLEAVAEALQGDAAASARLVQKVSGALVSGDGAPNGGSHATRLLRPRTLPGRSGLQRDSQPSNQQVVRAAVGPLD